MSPKSRYNYELELLATNPLKTFNSPLKLDTSKKMNKSSALLKSTMRNSKSPLKKTTDSK